MTGWKEVALGDVAELDTQRHDGSDKPFVGLEHIESGTGRLLRDVGQSEAESGTFRFGPDHVLYGRLRPYLNKAHLPTFEGHCSTEIYPIRPQPALDRRYLFYWLTAQTTIDAIMATCTGARMPRANLREVLKLSIPLPLLAEQERIVEILDEALEGVALAFSDTVKAIENARSLSAATIASLTSEAVSWEVHTIRTLIERGVLEKLSDGNHGEIHPTKDEYVERGVPFIMASDLREGQVDQKACRFISEHRASALRVGFARDGDVLLSHKGTIGRVARLKTDLPYVMLTPQVTYYRVRDQNVLLSKYLYHALRGRKFQEQLKEVAGIGSTRAYIGITRQLDLQLALPPVGEQARLSDLFDRVDRDAKDLERFLAIKLAALAELKQSLLARAFSGELTREPLAA